MPVRSLGYIYFETPALDRWDEFGRDFIGLMPVDGPDPTVRYFRMDEYPHRIMVGGADQFGLVALGFEVGTEGELRSVADAVSDYGIEVTLLPAPELDRRRISGGVAFQDPGGNPVELFYGPILTHRPVQTPLVSRFVTGDMGMGHAIVSASDPYKTASFYTEVLGFWERNTLSLPQGGLWFLGCNPRHHTLGVMPGDGPALMHWMVEAASLDDVGYAIDRADQLGIPTMNSLGKHTNDHMVSFYVYSPEYCAVEIGWNGMRIDGQQPTYEITAGAFWGHKFFAPPAGT